MGQNGIAERPVSLWHNRDYLLLWLGQAVSSLGTGISQLAFPLLILALTHSPAAAGFAGALERVPYLLFTLPAGALVDRWERKHIMIVCALGLALCLISIPVTLVSGHLTIIQIYLVSFAVGTFSIFYELAEFATLAYIVPRQQLSTAVAQDEAVYSTNSLLAPSLSGFLFSVGRIFPFVADVVSYLVLLGALLRMRTPFQEKRDTAPRHLLLEVREGIHWLWFHPVVRFLAFLTGYLYMLINGSILIVLVIAQQHQVQPEVIGLIFAVGGIGNIFGTILTTPVQRHFRLGRVIVGLLIVFILLWPFYGIATTPIFLGIVVAGLALPDSIYSILASSYRLTMVPDELQGRVGSTYRLILFGSLTAGQALIGISLQHFGVLITVVWLWSGLILFAILMLASSQLRGVSSFQEQ